MTDGDIGLLKKQNNKRNIGVTVNYLELIQCYILSHTVIPKSYFIGAVKLALLSDN